MSRALCTVITVLILGYGLPGMAQSSSEWKAAWESRMAIVEVESVQETGAAWAVSREGDIVTFATAWHTLKDADSSVVVRLRKCGRHPATVEAKSANDELDLVVFRARLPRVCHEAFNKTPPPRLAKEVLIHDQAVGRSRQSLFAIVGDVNAGLRLRFIPVILESWGGNSSRFETNYVFDSGMSGGVVVTKYGEFVGMITEERSVVKGDRLMSHLDDRGVDVTLLGSFGALELRGHPDIAQLVVDNEPKEPIPRMRYIEPGMHTARLVAVGYQRTPQFEFTIEADQVLPLCADLAPPISTWWRTTRWFLLGGSAALLAVGGVTGGLALRERSRFDGSPTVEGYERTKSLNRTTDIMLGLGLAGIVTFAVGTLTLNATSRSHLGKCE